MLPGKDHQVSDPVPAIEIRGLTKRYEWTLAVKGIDLTIAQGTFFGFVGPNGAGKSTTIKAMCGLVKPSAGTIKIQGFDISSDPIEVKKRIGVMLEEPIFYERLTGLEFLEFLGQLYGMERDRIIDRRKFLMDLMQLEGNKLIVSSSLGMKRKLALAGALIHEPPVIILDEPFSGIDAPTVVRIRRMLNELVEKGHTIFLSSHQLDTVERLSREVGIIHEGRLLATGSLDALREQAGLGPDASLEDVFLKLVGIEEVPAQEAPKPE